MSGRVRADYLRIKQQESTEKLFRNLLIRYDVRIMPPGDTAEEPTQPDKDSPKPDEDPSRPKEQSAESDEEQAP